MLIYGLLCLVALVKTQDVPIVKTTQGKVQGVRANDGDYYAYYGIHYGGDTSGANRFKAPTQPPNYNETFIAKEDVLCAQPSSEGLVGTEDCLRLNIFTPATVSNTRRPVIVYILGEEFTTSNPLEHSFKRLVQEDLVVVAVNYRVSIFGFLCLGTTDAPGNAGLKDVIQALQWIKGNIARFGGDNENVMLVGHGSGGAAVVDFITISTESVGLVQKAIVLSGSALSSWSITNYPVKRAREFARKFSFTTGDETALAKLFTSTSASDLANALRKFELELTNSSPFVPCVENMALNRTAFMTDAPSNLLILATFNRNVPLIYGYVDNEGTICAEQANSRNWLAKMNSNFANFLPANLKMKEEEQKQIREFYFKDQSIDINVMQNYTQYYGDSMIIWPLIWSATLRRRHSFADVRIFEFKYKGTNALREYPKRLDGVPHGQLLNYLLDFDLKENSVDKKVSNMMISRLVTFAKNGNPNYDPEVIWERLTDTFENYMIFKGEQDFVESLSRIGPASEVRKLWDPLYSRRHVIPQFNSSGKALAVTMLVLLCQVLAIVYQY